MRIHLKSVFPVLKITFREWWQKDPFRESAIIAYYSVFSLPGLLVVVVTFAGYFFGNDVVNAHVADQITATVGAETAKQIQNMIVQASETKNSFWATVIGVGSIVVGATGVFAQFQQSLNLIWKVKVEDSKSGIWAVIRVRIFSFGLIISIAFLLIVSLIVSAVLSALGNWISEHFSDSFLVALQVANFMISFIIIAILFALMFKFFPDAQIKWADVWVGSLVTAFLFEIGKFGLGLYFGTANPGVGYGAAGSIILILLWVSYSSMLVLFGAEFTHTYALKNSGRVLPSEIAKTAVLITPG
ncbi:MAG: YihY/virulence factor BrkB family protein [Bacteroidetes bacterium]|nr:YihY/virulence factor BrkB family protein [Bacteroidota bacterium]